MPSEVDDSRVKDKEEPSVGAALPLAVKDESESPKGEIQITATEKSEMSETVSATEALKMETKEDDTIAAPLEDSQVSATEKVSWSYSRTSIFEMIKI